MLWAVREKKSFECYSRFSCNIFPFTVCRDGWNSSIKLNKLKRKKKRLKWKYFSFTECATWKRVGGCENATGWEEFSCCKNNFRADDDNAVFEIIMKFKLIHAMSVGCGCERKVHGRRVWGEASIGNYCWKIVLRLRATIKKRFQCSKLLHRRYCDWWVSLSLSFACRMKRWKCVKRVRWESVAFLFSNWLYFIFKKEKFLFKFSLIIEQHRT